MITLYLNHFRGFEDTFIPLEDVSFLLGENSTGKTSVLTALRVLCGHSAWVVGRFQIGDEVIGGFNDFASNGVPWFQIGYSRHDPAGEGRYDGVLLTFSGSGGKVPWVMDVRLRTSSTDIHFHWDGNLFYEKQAVVGDMAAAFRAWTRLDPSCEGLPMVEDESPDQDSPMGMIIALHAQESASYEERMTARMQTMDKAAGDYRRALLKAPGGPLPAVPVFPEMEKPPRSFPTNMSWIDDFQWLAPIRAKPRRSYDAVAQGYSPEGDHVPWQLRGLSDQSKLRNNLRDYGTRSGLYDDVETRKFGDTEDAPFELRVRLGDLTPNVVNVGYGVSQVLPVIAGVVDPGLRGAWFALQQPEVHLHPRAQAALGELLFEAALPPQGKRFLVETHSDYVIDRFRYRMRKAAEKGEPPLRVQVLFFERAGGKNVVHRMQLTADGEYPETQPAAFRAFFLEEELRNLGY
jgi:hypothetical protein